MTKSLPSRPNLEQLKKQAKELLKSIKSSTPEAVQRVREFHPHWAKASEAEVRAARFSLNDAQLVIAREYGFATWPKLKAHVDSHGIEKSEPLERLKKAFTEDDAALFAGLLEQNPQLKATINEPVAGFDAPLICAVRSRQMLDVLLAAGADLNAKSRWWAGGFGLLHCGNPDLAAYAIERGAVVDAHAAARLGLIQRLRELVSRDPSLVQARGGDGQTPLHFASTVEIAECLLEHGAEMDARDVDHESTPAQYMTGDRQHIARYLVGRGCQTDLLMAAALGDAGLVRKHLEADPGCIRMRVSEEFFPMVGGKTGGTIYQWTLGWYVSAHQVAEKFGHHQLFDLLIEHSPAHVRLLVACWLGDHATTESLLAAHPNLVANLSAADRRQAAHAARNNDLVALRVMLEAGLPVDARSQHDATPLHWAGFHGNAEMARTILRYHPPLEVADRDFKSTPLGWAIHGSENGWYRRTGDYAATVEALLRAGAKPPEKVEGTDVVKEVLRRFGAKHPA